MVTSTAFQLPVNSGLRLRLLRVLPYRPSFAEEESVGIEIGRGLVTSDCYRLGLATVRLVWACRSFDVDGLKDVGIGFRI